MTRYVVPLTMLALFAGCQGQKMPSMNILAPYGPTRIPPPSTGSFGQPNTYYQPPQQGAPQVAPGGSSGVTTQPLSLAGIGKPTLASAASTTGQRDGSANDQDSSKTSSGASEKATNSSQVRLASANRKLGSEPPPRIVEPRRQESSQSIELHGMHVNDATQPNATQPDATQPNEPGRFVAPERMADISQLPPATRPAPQPVATRPISTRTPAAAPAAEQSPQEISTEKQSTGWQTRENAQPTLRVAGR